jgi:protein transport protein SEC24
MFSIHNMSLDAGVPSDNMDEPAVAGPDRIRLPSILNLSSERLTSDGIYLLENGHDMYMWVGRAVNHAILNMLFGLQTLEGADLSQLNILPANSEYSVRVDAILRALRSERSRYMQLHFIREGDGFAEAYFSRFLVEDRLQYLYKYIYNNKLFIIYIL